MVSAVLNNYSCSTLVFPEVVPQTIGFLSKRQLISDEFDSKPLLWEPLAHAKTSEF